MLGLPGKIARKRCSFATCSIFEPGSVMATKWRPAFSCPTASTVLAQKNWKKMFGSSVLPLLLETMNKVVKAENEKVAAVDFATATETMADGARRAEIKHAEGIKQAKILEAEGEALAIQLVNEAADRYFTGNAQLLRRLITVERSNGVVTAPIRFESRAMGSPLRLTLGSVAPVRALTTCVASEAN